MRVVSGLLRTIFCGLRNPLIVLMLGAILLALALMLAPVFRAMKIPVTYDRALIGDPAVILLGRCV